MATQSAENMEELRKGIITQIATLARLLGTMPNDDPAVIEAGEALLKLSMLIGRALGMQMSLE